MTPSGEMTSHMDPSSFLLNSVQDTRLVSASGCVLMTGSAQGGFFFFAAAINFSLNVGEFHKCDVKLREPDALLPLMTHTSIEAKRGEGNIY